MVKYYRALMYYKAFRAHVLETSECGGRADRFLDGGTFARFKAVLLGNDELYITNSDSL